MLIWRSARGSNRFAGRASKPSIKKILSTFGYTLVRAVAEMRFQYGMSELEVHPKDLGRFHYPTGPVSEDPVSDLTKDTSATRTNSAGASVAGA